MLKHRFRLQVPLFVLVLAASLLPAQAQNATDVYNKVKAAEAQFKLPSPHGVAVVGTLDAATGKFTGLVTTSDRDDADIPDNVKSKINHGKPNRGSTSEPAMVTINGLTFSLTFHVKNRKGPFTVITNGHTITQEANSITVNIGGATTVNWSVSCNGKTKHDRLLIERPPVVGAGAFTIPVVPISIIYAPPQDSRKMNTVTYANAHSMGTSISLGFSQEDSVTKPAEATFSSVMDVKNGMNLAAAGLAATGNPYAEAAAVVLKLIATGLGDTSATETKGTRVTNEHTLEVVNGESASYTTDPQAMPGQGDRILFYKNAKLVWLWDGKKLMLGLLGHSGIAAMDIGTLRNSQNNQAVGLSADTIKSLLSLDPFVSGGTNAALPPNRFHFVEHYELSGGHDTHTFSYQITQSDMSAKADYTLHTVDERKGWLSFLGLGITEDKTTKTTVTHSSSKQVKVSDMVEVRADLYAKPGEIYGVDAYYDSVFGTFCFRSADLQQEAGLSGKVQNKEGKPAANQMVTVMVGGQKFTTRTDAQGQYQFRATALKSMMGKATLLSGDMKQEIELRGIPIKDLKLQINRP